MRRRSSPWPIHEDEDELAGTEQPFVAHLVELRDRLIRPSIAVGVVAGVLLPLARPGGALRPARGAAGGAPAARARTLIATTVISPFLVPLKITADGGVPDRAAGGAVPGLGLRRAGPVHRTRRSWCCRWWSPARCCSSSAWRSATSSCSARCSRFIQSFAPQEHHRGAGHRGLPELRADDVHRLRRRLRGADRGRRAGAHGLRQHREAEGVPRLLHRARLHHRRRA